MAFFSWEGRRDAVRAERENTLERHTGIPRVLI
jgi:hypothetical protein